jgi:hypothetical protein
MDLYIALFQVYSDYTLEQITASKGIIRSLLQKVLNEKLVKYFPFIENFYFKLIFKIIGDFYRLNKKVSNEKITTYISSYLETLGLHGVINEQKIYYYVNLFEESLINSSAKILCNLKQMGEEEVNTIGQIDLQQRLKQAVYH